MATVVDYALVPAGGGLSVPSPRWYRLHDPVALTDYISIAASDPVTGAYEIDGVPPAEYQLYFGTLAGTVLGTPTLADAHYRVAYVAGDAMVGGSFTSKSTGPYSSDFPGGVTNPVTTGSSEKVYDKGGAWVNLAGPKYRNIGTWDPTAGTGDCLAALNQAILDGTPLLPPGTYNISGAPTNANATPLLMIGAAFLSGAGAAATTANIVRLGYYPAGALFVASTGSDSNVGSAASPFLTLQRAVNVAKDFVGVGVGCFIYVASGSYAGIVYSSNGLSFNSSGSSAAPAAITISGGYGGGTTTITKGSANGCVTVAGYGASLTLVGTITFTSTGNALFTDQGGMITLNSASITFGACTLAHLHADRNSMIQIQAGYTVSGNAPAHLETTLRGFIGYSEVVMTVTLSGNPVFSTAFAYVQAHGTIYVPSADITFTGAAGATTVRFWVRDNSLLETNGGTATYLPGTASGQCTNGGRYMPMPIPVLSGVTGFGTGATAVLRGGSNDYEGVIEISTTATAPGTTGTVTLTPGTAAPSQMGAIFMLGPGSAAWNARATVQNGSTLTLQAVVATIDNNAVNFALGTLEIYYRLQAA